MQNKRFTIVLVSIFSIMILPLAYSYVGLDMSMQQAVLTGIITICSIYVGGQSISDTAKYYK